MNAASGQAGTPRARRRWLRWLLVLCALPFALLWLVVWIALPPERVVPMVLARIGAAMNLEISAQGDPSSQLGQHPTFVVRNVVAREPGAATPLLQARRILVALPWSTIRSLGDTLDLVRVELDAPVLDVPALRHWLASRPPSETRLPTLSDGLQVRAGRVDGNGWRIEALALSIPRLHPDQPLRAQAQGRYVDATLQAPFDLAATLARPASGRGFGLAGRIAPERDGWRLPAWVTLSGALHWTDAIALLPAKFGASVRHVSGATEVPFAIGVHGPLRSQDGAWTLVPANVALRGGGLVPTFDARGRLAYGQRLLLDLDGRIAQWPADWPALPPPLGASREPLSVSLAYAGAASFSDPLQLRVSRNDPASSMGQVLRFDGHLELPAFAAWASSGMQDSPLPPLTGRLETPRIEVSGAQLEGVVIEFEEGPDKAYAPVP
ncbi:hypothetical protein FQY83_14145 [Luteimonas marina]|uniref:AsmA family protein n=1 Tax=Luteimonas marina TaxID=488485 RepID=A0A5C5TXN8_9GAMM|nr:hypothetical protein [Luteimonas marina]TWT18516.1 hypothetical protein FQY83_14145 [Luteimonas marina]